MTYKIHLSPQLHLLRFAPSEVSLTQFLPEFIRVFKEMLQIVEVARKVIMYKN